MLTIITISGLRFFTAMIKPLWLMLSFAYCDQSDHIKRRLLFTRQPYHDIGVKNQGEKRVNENVGGR